MSAACIYCGKGEPERPLRPYGPGGAWLCFPCMKETPDREAAAHAAFDALLNAAGAMTPVVAIGTSAGPQPVTAIEDLLRTKDEREDL